VHRSQASQGPSQRAGLGWVAPSPLSFYPSLGQPRALCHGNDVWGSQVHQIASAHGV